MHMEVLSKQDGLLELKIKNTGKNCLSCQNVISLVLEKYNVGKLISNPGKLEINQTKTYVFSFNEEENEEILEDDEIIKEKNVSKRRRKVE